MGSECLFCGTGGASILSKEDVVPVWLLKYLELPPDDQLFQGVADSATGELIRRRIHSSFTFFEGRVCKTACNNGWMSRLESGTKPILIPLMENKRPVADLSPTEKAIVGKWAVKTAYMHSWATPLKSPVQLPHVRALNGDHGMPADGVHVFGMQATFVKPNSYFQSGTWPHFRPSTADAAADIPEQYKVGLQFKHLYLVTVFWPDLDAQVIPVRNIHKPIWPVHKGVMLDYPGQERDDNPWSILPYFTNSLALLHKPQSA